MTELDKACLYGNYDSAKRELDAGEDPSKDAMISAAYFGHIKIVKLLLRHNAKDYEAAILYAKMNDHPEIVKLLERYKEAKLHEDPKIIKEILEW